MPNHDKSKASIIEKPIICIDLTLEHEDEAPHASPAVNPEIIVIDDNTPLTEVPSDSNSISSISNSVVTAISDISADSAYSSNRPTEDPSKPIRGFPSSASDSGSSTGSTSSHHSSSVESAALQLPKKKTKSRFNTLCEHMEDAITNRQNRYHKLYCSAVAILQDTDNIDILGEQIKPGVLDALKFTLRKYGLIKDSAGTKRKASADYEHPHDINGAGPAAVSADDIAPHACMPPTKKREAVETMSDIERRKIMIQHVFKDSSPPPDLDFDTVDDFIFLSWPVKLSK